MAVSLESKHRATLCCPGSFYGQKTLVGAIPELFLIVLNVGKFGAALKSSGCLDNMSKRGIKYVDVCSVDNAVVSDWAVCVNHGRVSCSRVL